MSKLATEIQQTSACGADYQMHNPVVLQAYTGFVAYSPLYHAGCLMDSNNQYCFADAATNTSSYQSTYVYYLPLGVQLPSGSQPACTPCMHNTLGIFAQAASNKTQPLSLTYNSAAQQIDAACGSSFAEVAGKSSSIPMSPLTHVSGLLGTLTLASMLWNFLI